MLIRLILSKLNVDVVKGSVCCALYFLPPSGTAGVVSNHMTLNGENQVRTHS